MAGLAAAAQARMECPEQVETAAVAAAVIPAGLAEKAQCFYFGLKGINHEIRMD
jgi:hypothetical protein